ncbi:MAG: NUDIX hydrolase [Catenisphaera adipataccumulans]|jgi:ADP-ribose pyrophosphatase|uniref:NUDIX hydrolase n=1 Tax=Catenisphaera adipataccumulans TaxID=700500 RepID=UPI003D8E6DA7
MKDVKIYQGTAGVLYERTFDLEGMTLTKEVFKHPGGVGVIVIQDGKLLLVRQYRHAIDQKTLEIPAGKRRPGEDPETAGLRELNEETGLTCEHLQPVTSFLTTPGFCDERIWLFEAVDPKPADKRLACDDDEFIDLVWMPIDEALRQVKDGTIDDAKTVIAILRIGMERINS